MLSNKRILALVLSLTLMLTCIPALAEGAAERDTSPIELSVFVDHAWFWIDSYVDTPVAQKLTEATGVTLKVTKASDDTQLPVLIASGNYPDMIYTSRLSDQLANSKVCYAYNDLIAQYAPNYPVTEKQIQLNTAPDGNYYAIMNMTMTEEILENPYVLPHLSFPSAFVKSDIYEGLGSPELTNLDQVYDMLLKCKEQYPDMIPLICTWGAPEDYVLSRYGVGGYIYADGNEIKFTFDNPAYKEALAFMNKLIRNGLIPAESLIYNNDQNLQALSTQNVFMAFGNLNHVDTANESLISDGKEERYVLINSPLSDNATNVDMGIGFSNTYITKNCKAPDRAIQFMEYCSSEEGQRLTAWGIEGKDYTLKDGVPALSEETAALRNSNYDKMVAELGIGCWCFGVGGGMENMLNYYSLSEDKIAYLQEAKKTWTLAPELYLVTPKTDSDETIIYNKILDFRKAQVMKVMTSGSDEEFEANWTAFIDGVNSMGKQQVCDWMTAQYAQYAPAN